MAQSDSQARYGERRAEAAKRRRDVLGRLEALLASNDINLDEVGEIEKVRVNEWEVVTKDKDGNPVKTPARAASIVINPTWESGPKWPLPEPAKPTVVKVPKPSGGPTLLRGWKTALVEPDAQIGFLRGADGVTLHPTHDPRALDVSEQIAEAERPHDYVNLGDYLDLAEMGRYRLEPGQITTTQPAIEEGHRHLAVQAALTSGRKWVHEGNHDQRLVNYLLDNAMAAFGLKRAAAPDDWPVLSLPYLLRFDELGVDYEDGYPANWRYINERLATVHGTSTSARGRTAAQQYLASEVVSVIFGHDHKSQTVYLNRGSRERMFRTFAHSPGTLARIDGAVPGGGKYRGRKIDGTPKKSWQNWHQGITIVRYVPGDGPALLEHIEINEGVAVHRGQVFESRVSL